MQCAYVLVIMAAYWVTEALPLAITSIIPIILLPLFGKAFNLIKFIVSHSLATDN